MRAGEYWLSTAPRVSLTNAPRQALEKGRGKSPIADVDRGYQKRINISKELPSVGNNMFTGFPDASGNCLGGLRFLGLIFHC